MTTFSICITTTWQSPPVCTFIKVRAKSREQAEEMALEKARNYPQDCEWTDDLGDAVPSDEVETDSLAVAEIS